MRLNYKIESVDELRAKLKSKYPQLTESDLHVKNEQEKDMLTMVAYKLRKSKEEMSKIIEDL